MPRPQYKTEKEGCKQAFEIYYALGQKRTYQKVADQLGVSKSTIKKWGKSFGWQNRVEVRNSSQKPPSGPNASSSLSLLKRYLKLVEAAEVVSIQQLSEERTKPTIRELIRLIEARMTLDGISESGEPNTQLAKIIIYDSHR